MSNNKHPVKTLSMKEDIIEGKLETVKKFQIRFPNTHVGGSIGLFLHGIDLKRDFKKSDIDLTSATPLSFAQPLDIENAQESSNPEDFDYAFRVYPTGSGYYTKVDINVRPEKEFDLIPYSGFMYKVSKLSDIYFYKSAYAIKGAEKHIDDFISIVTGIRPERPVPVTPDDLPF